MVQIKEFRIVMPVSLEEYQVAQAFMVMKMQQQNTSSTEGVDVLESRPFQDDVLGAGHYTSKLYRLQSKAPAWLTAFAPADALILQEEAWNAYPKCKTVIKCPYFTKFSLTIETVHKADNGKSDNVHGLSKQQLAVRQVEILDIAKPATDYWSYAVGSNNIDFSDFRSVQTGRGPLCEGWQEKCNPVMTAYKVVTIDAPYWGFGYRLEQALLAGERALFQESHRNCFAWIDEWFGMSMERIRELERQCKSSIEEVIVLEFKSREANFLSLHEFSKQTFHSQIDLTTTTYLLKMQKAGNPAILNGEKDAFSRSQLNSEQHGFPLAVSEGS